MGIAEAPRVSLAGRLNLLLSLPLSARCRHRWSCSYLIYRDGVEISSVSSGTLDFTDTGCQRGKSHSYRCDTDAFRSRVWDSKLSFGNRLGVCRRPKKRHMNWHPRLLVLTLDRVIRAFALSVVDLPSQVEPLRLRRPSLFVVPALYRESQSRDYLP